MFASTESGTSIPAVTLSAMCFKLTRTLNLMTYIVPVMHKRRIQWLKYVCLCSPQVSCYLFCGCSSTLGLKFGFGGWINNKFQLKQWIMAFMKQDFNINPKTIGIFLLSIINQAALLCITLQCDVKKRQCIFLGWTARYFSCYYPIGFLCFGAFLCLLFLLLLFLHMFFYEENKKKSKCYRILRFTTIHKYPVYMLWL